MDMVVVLLRRALKLAEAQYARAVEERYLDSILRSKQKQVLSIRRAIKAAQGASLR